VNKEAGVTRDWQYSEGWLAGIPLHLYDTAGFEEATRNDPTLLSASRKKGKPAYGGGTDILPGRRLAKELKEAILEQTESVVSKADVILLLVDAREGVTPEDEYFARWLRQRAGLSVNPDVSGYEDRGHYTPGEVRRRVEWEKSKHAPVILVANKCETGDIFEEGSAVLQEIDALGLGDVVPISAAHGEGFGELHNSLNQAADRIEKISGRHPLRESYSLNEKGDKIHSVEESGQESLKLSIVGRPNVGKSTLLNSLLGSQRALASPVPGTTRNTVTQSLQVLRKDNNEKSRRETDYRGNVDVELTDTAGIKRVKSVLRKETRLFGEVDTAAMAQALESIRRSNVTCLLVDATGSDIKDEDALSFESYDSNTKCTQARNILTSHDLRIAEYASAEGRPLIVLLNKWDQVPSDARRGLKMACATVFYDVISHQSRGYWP